MFLLANYEEGWWLHQWPFLTVGILDSIVPMLQGKHSWSHYVISHGAVCVAPLWLHTCSYTYTHNDTCFHMCFFSFSLTHTSTLIKSRSHICIHNCNNLPTTQKPIRRPTNFHEDGWINSKIENCKLYTHQLQWCHWYVYSHQLYSDNVYYSSIICINLPLVLILQEVFQKTPLVRLSSLFCCDDI